MQYTKYGLQNFQNTNTNSRFIFNPKKKWETKLGHFGKISVICHEYITTINIRYIYSFMIIIYIV